MGRQLADEDVHNGMGITMGLGMGSAGVAKVVPATFHEDLSISLGPHRFAKLHSNELVDGLGLEAAQTTKVTTNKFIIHLKWAPLPRGASALP